MPAGFTGGNEHEGSESFNGFRDGLPSSNRIAVGFGFGPRFPMRELYRGQETRANFG